MVEALKTDIELSLSDDQRQKYRQLKSSALHAIRIHRGEETTFRALMDALVQLETWLQETFGEGGKIRLSDDDERGIAFLAGSHSGTIDDLLGATSRRLTNLTKGKLTPAQIAIAHCILHLHEDAVLVPPGEQEMKKGNGNGEWKEREYTPRLQELIVLLAEHEIYTDDLVCITGTNAKNMVRQESYVLVEIPRLKKQILICNEVGEATFVSHAILSRRTFFQSTKDDLLGMGLERIVYGPRWSEQLTAALFREGEELQKKVNVRDREEMRKLIMSSMTSQEWIEPRAVIRRTFNFAGKGIQAIATLFGVTGKVQSNNLAQLRLGAAIYGADDPFIAPALQKEEEDNKKTEALGEDPDKWRIFIKKNMSAEQWVHALVTERIAFNFAGKGLAAIATLFGVTGECQGSNLSQLRLGAAIYGTDDSFIASALKKAEEEWKTEQEERVQAKSLGEDPDKWRIFIKKNMSAEQWVHATVDERIAFNFAGKGIQAIATLFGVTGEGRGSNLSQLRLGAAIYGTDDSFIASALKKAEEEWKTEQEERVQAKSLGEDPDKWRIFIKKNMSAEQWVHATVKQRSEWTFAGKGLGALATLFGIIGKVFSNNLSQLLLGAAIYGADDPFIAPVLKKVEEENKQTEVLGEDLDKWRAFIKQKKSAEQWVLASTKERNGYRFAGRSLTSLAAPFCVTGNVAGSILAQLHLGAAIFGEDDPHIKSAIAAYEAKKKKKQEA